MAIRVSCPHCDEVYSVSDDLAGRKIRCRGCQGVVQIPGGRTASPVKKTPPPPASRRDDDDRPRRRRDEDDRPRRRRDDDYDDELPRRRSSRGKKSEKRSPALLIGISAGGVALIGLAIGVIVWANHTNSKVDKLRVTNAAPPVLVNQQKNAVDDEDKPEPEPPKKSSAESSSTAAPKANTGSDNGPRGENNGRDVGQRVYQRLLKSTVLIWAFNVSGGRIVSMEQGSGTLIDKDNKLILTNYHVVGSHQLVAVFFPSYRDGKLIAEPEYFIKDLQKHHHGLQGHVLKTDQKHDLALVEVDHLPDGVEPLPLATEPSEVGDIVYSVGNAGAANGYWIYTRGSIRQFLHNQEMHIRDEGGLNFTLHSDIILTDSQTNPGDSGGPLVNHRAEMIGVTQSLVSGARALSNFIDVGEVRKFLDVCSRLSGIQMNLAKGPGLIGVADDLPALVKDLTGSDKKARLAAATKLAQRGPEAKLAIAPLVRCLKEDDPTLRGFVRNALAKIGAPSDTDVPGMLDLLDDSSALVRLTTVEELTLAGPNARVAVSALVKHLADRDSRVRRKAAEAVSKIGVDPNERDSLLPKLTEAIKDRDAAVRAAAAQAMATLPYGPEDVSMLSKYLAQEDSAVRTFAASALAKVGPAARDTVPALVAAFKGADKPLKVAVMQAVAAIGAEAKDAMPQIKLALADGDLDVRRNAVAAAAVMGKDAVEALPLLADAVKEPKLRLDALAALKKLGHHARDGSVVSAVVDALSDKSSQDASIATLTAIAPHDQAQAAAVAAGLLPLFEDKPISLHNSKVSNALAALGKNAVGPLTQALSNAEAGVRMGAAEALGELGRVARTRACLQALTQCARTDKTVEVRQACISALSRIRSR